MTNVQCDLEAPKIHPSFNSKEASVVLRSTEDTLYRIPPFVLRNTTAHFRAIFSPPAPLGQARKDDEPQASQIMVDVKDVVLERFLRLISGLETPMWESFDEIEPVMSLAERWGAQGPMSLVRAAITAPKFLSDPIRLYGLATRFGWEQEAKLASTHTLKLCLYDDEHADQLCKLSSKSLLDLLNLHRRRRDLFKLLLDTEESFIAGNNHERYCPGCGEEIDNHSWRELKAKMFFEMDQRPLGDTLLGLDIEEWRESNACWSAKCRKEGCGRQNYDKLSTMRNIHSCIDRLPLTI